MTTKRIGMLLCAGLLLGSAACSSDRLTMLDPSQPHYGMTYEDWTVAWWRWLFAQPGSQNAALDATGANCAVDQDPSGPVFFLAGNFGGPTVRPDCAFSAGKAIFFPLVISYQDNVGVPAGQEATAAEMLANSTLTLDLVITSSLEVTLDSKPLDDPTAGKEGPTLFSYTLPTGDNFYSAVGLPGISGTVDPTVTSGYWVMLPPQPAGRHELRWAGAQGGTEPFSLDITYELTLQ